VGHTRKQARRQEALEAEEPKKATAEKTEKAEGPPQGAHVVVALPGHAYLGVGKEPVSGHAEPSLPGVRGGLPGVVDKDTVSALAEPLSHIAVAVPDLAQSVPDLAESVPGVTEPVPGIAQPVPGIAQPVPGVTEPVPGIAQPLSVVAQPVPVIAQPVSAVAHSLPDIAEPLPLTSEAGIRMAFGGRSP
jgi:hypothetical protein